MSRIFKFRAWHKGYPYSGSFKEQNPQMLYEDVDRPGDCFVWLRARQPIEIMQFTGLTDKNGVDIYEGDIVRKNLHTLNGKYDFIGLVIYADAGFYIKKIKQHTKHYMDKLVEIIGIEEVIGNKHENQELLDANK